jgi:hypothetical protein
VGLGKRTTRCRRAGWWGLALTASLGIVAFGAPAGASLRAGSSSGSSELTQAHRALLVLSDMPSGWKSTKSPNNPNSTVGDSQLAHCLGVATSLITENPPSVNSPQFQNPSGTLTVNDNVTVFPSDKNAQAELGTVSNKKLPACMTALASGPLKTKLFGKAPKGVTYGTPLVSSTDSSTFPFTAGYSMSVPAHTDGEVVNITVTQLVAIKGRLGQQITFTSIGQPFSITTTQHISAAAIQRL